MRPLPLYLACWPLYTFFAMLAMSAGLAAGAAAAEPAAYYAERLEPHPNCAMYDNPLWSEQCSRLAERYEAERTAYVATIVVAGILGGMIIIAIVVCVVVPPAPRRNRLRRGGRRGARGL